MVTRVLLILAFGLMLLGARCWQPEAPKPHLYAMDLPTQCSTGHLIAWHADSQTFVRLRALPMGAQDCIISDRPQDMMACCSPVADLPSGDCRFVSRQRLRDTTVLCQRVFNELGQLVATNQVYSAE